MRLRIAGLVFLTALRVYASIHVTEVAIDSIIQPVSAEIIQDAINAAAKSGDALLLIRLNTPGGLSDAMRDGVAHIISSPVPVVAWVGPQGARGASAGFFLLEAADVAAMAPGTNIGAAHPVLMGGQMDPVMKEKLENDAAASLRSITLRRGRNVQLAESAVRLSKSFTEHEALDGHLIEIIAANEADLMRQLDGRVIKRFNGTEVTLRTGGALIEPYQLSFRESVLKTFSDPNVALLLLALGVLGIYVEFTAPGLIFPGVAGSILAVLALAAFSILPLNWLGVALIVLALCLFALEFKFVSHGILSTGGAVALVLGATMLVDSPIPEMRIRLTTSLGVALPLAAITALLVTLAVRARRSKVVTGSEGMIGQFGVALEDLSPEGRILVHGENWLARASAPVPRGSQVRVSGIADLQLRVDPVASAVAHPEEK